MLYDLRNTQYFEVEKPSKASHKHELGFHTNLVQIKNLYNSWLIALFYVIYYPRLLHR